MVHVVRRGIPGDVFPELSFENRPDVLTIVEWRAVRRLEHDLDISPYEIFANIIRPMC